MATNPLTRRLTRLTVAALLGGACAAIGVAAVGALAAGDAQAEPPKGGYPPDPPSTPSRSQWLFDVRVDKGAVSLERARNVTVKNAAATARVMGRYAVELWVGNELLDRIRFNVPIGADLPREDDGRPFRRPSFDKVSTRFTVKMADQPRAVYLKLVDRATGAESKYRWPPNGDTLVPFETPAPARSGAKPDGGPAPDGGPKPEERPDAGPGRDGGAGPDGGSDAGPRPDAGAAPGAPDAGERD